MWVKAHIASCSVKVVKPHTGVYKNLYTTGALTLVFLSFWTWPDLEAGHFNHDKMIPQTIFFPFQLSTNKFNCTLSRN